MFILPDVNSLLWNGTQIQEESDWLYHHGHTHWLQ